MIICFDQRNGNGCGEQNPNGTLFCRKCGVSLQFALPLHDPGVQINAYRILRILGFGGFGAVYETEVIARPGIHVALKETFDPNSIRGFRSEFAVLQQLQHPNLPGYREMFEFQGNGYLVMELIPGKDLEEIIENHQGSLAESQVVGYAIQLCDVLKYLHRQHPPILHRDIKPANIRLTPTGLIKLVDFGLLKQGVQTTRTTIRGAGTMIYAPIEQYGSGGLHTDPRSDIYSLGATLYRLLTGQLPLAAGIRIASPSDPLPSPRNLNPNLSPHVADAIVKAMSLLQKDRYPDTETLKHALVGANQPYQIPLTIQVPLPTVAIQQSRKNDLPIWLIWIIILLTLRTSESHSVLHSPL